MSYLERLEKSLFNREEFERVYRALEADKAVNAQQMHVLAKAFIGKAGRTRNQSLGYIYGRRASLNGVEARACAINGRVIS